MIGVITMGSGAVEYQRLVVQTHKTQITWTTHVTALVATHVERKTLAMMIAPRTKRTTTVMTLFPRGELVTNLRCAKAARRVELEMGAVCPTKTAISRTSRITRLETAHLSHDKYNSVLQTNLDLIFVMIGVITMGSGAVD